MLFDLSQYRKPLPPDVQVFASGADQESEIRGFARLGIPVGVSVNHLNDASVSALLELGQPVMIDSGAFSEVMFTADGPRTIAPIEETEWSRRLSVYTRLASTLGPLAAVVAPDTGPLTPPSFPSRARRWTTPTSLRLLRPGRLRNSYMNSREPRSWSQTKQYGSSKHPTIFCNRHAEAVTTFTGLSTR